MSLKDESWGYCTHCAKEVIVNPESGKLDYHRFMGKIPYSGDISYMVCPGIGALPGVVLSREI